jgi:hypothetical protein
MDEIQGLVDAQVGDGLVAISLVSTGVIPPSSAPLSMIRFSLRVYWATTDAMFAIMRDRMSILSRNSRMHTLNVRRRRLLKKLPD